MRLAVPATVAGLVLISLAVLLLPAGRGAGAEAAATTIEAGDLWFCLPGDSACQTLDFGDVDIETTINAGDGVTWRDVDTGIYDTDHTVTQCSSTCDGPPPSTPLFDSRADPSDDSDPVPYNTSLDHGETYTFTFDTPGSYLYRCELHPLQMRGEVKVLAPPEPSPTSAPVSSPTPSIAPSPSPAEASAAGAAGAAAAVPNGGGAPPAGQADPALRWFAIAVGSLLLTGAAALTLRTAHRP